MSLFLRCEGVSALTLLSFACRDYQPMPHLDRYAGSELASQSESIDYSAEVAARRAAERQMDQRDVVEGRRTGRDTRLPDALHDDGARARCTFWRE